MSELDTLSESNTVLKATLFELVVDIKKMREQHKLDLLNNELQIQDLKTQLRNQLAESEKLQKDYQGVVEENKVLWETVKTLNTSKR